MSVDKISFWRSHRIDSENWFARLDAKTVRRLVAASHFSRRAGVWIFWSDFIASFWRGEVSWHWSAVAVALGRWILSRSRHCFFLSRLLSGCENGLVFPPFQRTGNWKRNFDFSGRALRFWRCLSIQFDFGNCINPVTGHPYFTSGRLLSGALIPFRLLSLFMLFRGYFVGPTPR
jgi:hypothetical protein